MRSMNLNMIEQHEKLLRSIFPQDLLWDTVRNKPSSAAFKDANGCSVDRTGDRTLPDSIDYLKKRFKKNPAVAVITKTICDEIQVAVKYAPSKKNIYHTEIHESDDVIEISAYKLKLLSDKCIVY